ncbi:nucleoside transmembrane transporter FUN26 [Rhodotorula paludigena]|uniref:nucleoside transmembrane transporter FUN26 n=1 Tax=Rhodotorula paludigena TaxID=86838 RepID=UPI00317F8B6E
MLGTSAPLARAVDKARTSAEHASSDLRSELHAAHELYADATRTPEQAAEEGEAVPERLSPEDAEEIVEDEYRPLMDDEGDAGESGRRGSGAKRGRAKRGHADGEVKVRRLEVWLAQGIFFILGACILLSWNTTIVAGSYFKARLEGSVFETSFSSFNALTFTTANLVFLAHANATQGTANLSRRISYSIVVLAVNLTLFIISTKIEQIPAGLFFAFLIISAVILAGSASYLQNAVVALSASFGPQFLNQILSGQGAIGFAVALIQFLAAYGAVKSEKATPSTGFRIQRDVTAALDNALLQTRAAVPPAPVRQSAFTFFLTVGVFAAVSFCSYLVLIYLPLYRLVVRASFEGSASRDGKDSSSSRGPSMRAVERKVRHLGVAMFLVFGVTLAVFPSITSTIVSVKTDLPDARVLQRPELFVPLGFAVFAAGDWLGRVLPQIERLAFTNWKWLMAGSVARIVFVPLFLACNQTAGGEGRAIIRSDLAFFFIMLVFAVSNGYLSTLIMLASVVEPSLEADEVEVAATCLAFYLTSGLAAGSFLSFAVRGAICQCNPFT